MSTNLAQLCPEYKHGIDRITTNIVHNSYPSSQAIATDIVELSDRFNVSPDDTIELIETNFVVNYPMHAFMSSGLSALHYVAQIGLFLSK